MVDDPTLQERIKGAWTHGAHEYDRDPGHGLLSPAAEREWLSVLGEALGGDALDVLDVGTGTGVLAVLVAKLGHRVQGIDLTPAMLEHAQRRAREAGVAVEFSEGDAMALPLDTDSVDAVVSRHVLWTMPDPAQALREWIRVSRPGGRVLWIDHFSPAPGPRALLRQGGAALLKRLRRAHDHADSHHYTPAMYAALPLRGMTDAAPLRALLDGLDVGAAEFRPLPALDRLTRRHQALHKRLLPRSRLYLGSFTVSG